MKRILILTLLLLCFTYISDAALYINEVNSTGKWIEIYNSGGTAVNVGGYFVTRYNNDATAKSVIIPAGIVIAPTGFLVLYQGTGSGGSAISPIVGAIDCLPFGISSSKFMRAELSNPQGQLVDGTFNIGYPQTATVLRDQSWARETDGATKIVALDPTPGKSNTSPVEQSDLKIYINEVDPVGKWIELYNDEATEINVGGYIITRNNNDDAVSYAAIPAGTIISAKGFLVLYRGSTAPSPVEGAIDCLPFGISSAKFMSVLLKDPQGKMVDNTFYIGDPQEVTVLSGQSWAREADGAARIVSLEPTPGKSNMSPPLVSDLKIYVNEVNASGNWIELYNDEDAETDISGFIIIRSNSDEAAGITAIPAGTTIASKGFLVLYQGPDNGGISPSPVAGAIDCIPFGISSTKFESVLLKDTQGNIVDNTFDIDDPQTVTVSGGQSWARVPDGSVDIKAQTPTPGVSNGQPSSIPALKKENNLTFVYAGTLHLPEETSYIQLYSVSGSLVLSQRIATTSVDLTSLPKGLYIVKLTISGKSYTQKIIL